MSDSGAPVPPRAGGLRRRLGGLRQRFVPSEFRIGTPQWPLELHPTLERIEKLRGTEQPPPDTAPGPDSTPPLDTEPPPRDLPSLDDDALVDAAVGLWRTQRRLDAAGDDGGTLARQLRRHVNGVWDGLAKLEVAIQMHDDDAFDSGMSLEVLAIEPRTGFTREVIIETVQPTVYRSGRVIRMGQVIVGRPERPSDT